MKYSSTILQASFLAAMTQANPISSHTSTQHKGIKWTPCNITDATMPMECATIKVPLDYTDKKCNQTIDLELQRVKAKGKSRGSVLVNFGGPGDSGTGDLAIFGKVIHSVAGGEHDIVNFVPRGTGKALEFTCFNDPVSRSVGMTPLAGDSSDVARGQIWAKGTIFRAQCAAKQNKTGNLIGTAFVARDMMQIVDALQEDGKLRYWGFSYGTILGATVMAMFPDRMDKIILDGVVNPTQYYENTEVDMFTDTDKVFKGFCKGCVETPSLCPLAKNRTASELEQVIFSALETLKQSPIAIPSPEAPGGGIIIDYSLVKAFILNSLYDPSSWPNTAKLFNTIITGEWDSSQPPPPAVDESTSQESIFGIKCSDVRHHTNSLTEMIPVLDARQNSSVFAPVSDQLPLKCAQWPIKAKEIYQGDFKVKTPTPVLLLTNTFDPVAPKIGAQNVTATLEGSVLMEQEGYGHCSLAQASLCTAKIVKAYFQQGKLPESGTKCSVDVPLFTNTNGWDGALKKL